MDIAHAYTDEELKKLERKFRKIYRQAADEMYEKLEIYLNSLAAKDAAMLTKLSNGKITSKQYQAWRAQQILVGEQMETIAADLAKSYTDANIMALKALNADLSDVFAENANYIMYAAEMVTGENYAFTLYNQNAVNRLIKDNPQLLPKPRVKIAKDRKWNQRVITSAVTQGILQGESMQNIAKRMHGEVSKGITVESIKNANRMTAEQVAKAVERRIMVAAMRTARTAVTGAENAGRLQGYKELQSNGVDIKQQWLATLDNRTRHEHRMLDGQIREIGEPFEVDGYKLDFPADPKGLPRLVYNCRCTTISVINGHEVDIDVRDKSAIGDYEEWKNGKKEKAEAQYEKYTPAKTKQEAEAFAKRFADNVNYDGVSLANANAINEQLLYLTQKYPINKMEHISNKSRGAMSASYSGININGRKLGSALKDDKENFRKKQEYSMGIIQQYRDRFGEKMPPSIKDRIAAMEKELQFTRWGVHSSYDDNVKSVLTHEYGHLLSDQYFGMLNQERANPNYALNYQLRYVTQRWDDAFRKAKKNGDIYKLSQYGSKNVREFFAESFLAREKGEKLPDYVEKLMQEVLKNGIM